MGVIMVKRYLLIPSIIAFSITMPVQASISHLFKRCVNKAYSFLMRSFAKKRISLFSDTSVKNDLYYGMKGYVSLHKDQQVKSKIDRIIKQYAPNDTDIRLYEKQGRYTWRPTTLDSVEGEADSEAKVVLLKADQDNGAIFYAMQNPSEYKFYPLIEGVVAHELGHIVNKSSQKRKWMSFVPSKSIRLAYDRYDERRADNHVIEHAQDPQVLYQMAQLFRENAHIPHDPRDPHPSCAERAAYFEKAAQKLEEKIARED